MDVVLTREAIRSIGALFDKDLLRSGADCALLIDRAGYLLANRGDPSNLDVVTLAALSAANYAATEEIARLVGEEDFTLMFHKGKQENIHYTKVGADFFLITLFAKDVSLGLMRLKTAKVADELTQLLNGEEQACPSST